MDAATLAGRVDEVQILDVRWPNEWEAGHIEGSVHIPVDDVAERAGELDRSRPVVAVCRSGSRSERAAGWLRGQGLDAENLDGGLEAWAGAGLPLVAGHGGPATLAEPEPPPDDRPEEVQALQAGILDAVFAAHEHFGDREPSEEEMQEFLDRHYDPPG